MSPSHLSTIRHDRPTLPLPRRLRRWLAGMLRELDPIVAQSAAACQADRYRKHFPAPTHVRMLLLHGLFGGLSLRQSYAVMTAWPDLVVGAAAVPVSYSQLAASSTSRPAEFLAGLIPFLVARVRRQQPRADLPAELRLIDATFLRLSQHHAAWLPIARGPQLQVLYNPALDLPEQVVLPEDLCGNDCQGIDVALLQHPDRLAALRDCTLVFDLGYYSHDRFRQLLEADIHLVTRYGQHARYQVLARLPIQPALHPDLGGRITIVADHRIELGSPNNRATKRLLTLRMVTADVTPTTKAQRCGKQVQRYVLLTDRWDLTAHEVVQFYLWRWEIELFFRWLKRTLQLVRLLGYSRNAVALSVWLAIIVHLLTLLASAALGFTRRSVLVRALLPFLYWSLTGWPDRYDLAVPCPDG